MRSCCEDNHNQSLRIDESRAKPSIHLNTFSVFLRSIENNKIVFSVLNHCDEKQKKKKNKEKRISWNVCGERAMTKKTTQTTTTTSSSITATWIKSSYTWNADTEKVHIFQLILCQSSVTHTVKNMLGWQNNNGKIKTLLSESVCYFCRLTVSDAIANASCSIELMYRLNESQITANCDDVSMLYLQNKNETEKKY